MCEEPDRFVKLQARPNPSSSKIQEGFSHPLTLDSEQWEPILASIRVQPSVSFLRRGDEQPAFTEEEIDYLSMTLESGIHPSFSRAIGDLWVKQASFILWQ